MWGEARRFVVVGITVTILHYAVYWLLMHYMEASVAFTIGYFVSFLANYYLSARYTFHKKKSLNNGIGFIAAHAFNYLLQVSLLKLMLYIGLSKTLAPLVSTPSPCLSTSYWCVPCSAGSTEKADKNMTVNLVIS